MPNRDNTCARRMAAPAGQDPYQMQPYLYKHLQPRQEGPLESVRTKGAIQ